LIQWLVENKLYHGRLNLMAATRPEAQKYELTPEQQKAAYTQIYEFLKTHPEIKWNPFREFIDNMLGKNLAPCFVNRCDPFCTICKSILPDGRMGNCDATFCLDAYYRTQRDTMRADILKETDCEGCRYWEICGGGCPMRAIDNDWRNKTRFCEAIKQLYSLIERDLRGLMPNVTLAVDVPNFYEEYHLKGKILSMNEIIESTWRRRQCSD